MRSVSKSLGWLQNKRLWTVAAAFAVAGGLVAQTAGVASAGTNKNSTGTCVSGTGQKITNALVCKGLAYYKGKTVTLVANGAVGAAADIVFRAIAPGVGAYLGASAVVGDTPSGAGISGTNTAAAAAPNGLTVGYLNLNQAIADQAQNVPGVNFPLSKIETVGGVKGTVSVLVSNASTGPKTIEAFLTTKTPIAVLQTLGSSFSTLVKMIIAAYHVVPAHIVTGYSSSANLTSGFVRGDGPVTGTSSSTLGSYVANGFAIPLLMSRPVQPGVIDYQYFKNVPTPATLLKKFPPKTKAGIAVMKALIAYENGSVSWMIMPRHTPSDEQAAMSAAMAYSWAVPATEALIAAGGTPPGLVPASEGPAYIAKGIASEKTLAKFLN